MVVLGLEPKTQTNPLRYGGTENPKYINLIKWQKRILVFFSVRRGIQPNSTPN